MRRTNLLHPLFNLLLNLLLDGSFLRLVGGGGQLVLMLLPHLSFDSLTQPLLAACRDSEWISFQSEISMTLAAAEHQR